LLSISSIFFAFSPIASFQYNSFFIAIPGHSWYIAFYQNQRKEIEIMYSILLVVEMPALHDSAKPNFREEDRYRTTISNLLELRKRSTNIETLGENVLLISIDNTLEPLSEVIRNLSEIPYRYTIFDEELKWHEVARKV
jgi:hypothetical protein